MLVLSRWLAPRIGFILRRASGSTVGNPPCRLLCARQQIAQVLWECLVIAICQIFCFGTDFHAGHKQFSSRPCAFGYWLALWLLALFCHTAQGGPLEVHETATSSPGSYGGMGLLSAANVFLCFNKEVSLTVSYLLHTFFSLCLSSTSSCKDKGVLSSSSLGHGRDLA